MNSLYQKTFWELGVYMVKRLILLAAKLVGFKSFCFLLATYLLFRGVIDQNVWLYAMIIVVCNTSGLRIADAWTAGRVFGRPVVDKTGACQEVYEDEVEKNRDGFDDILRTAADRTDSSAVRRAVSRGKQRIRALLAGKSGKTSGGDQR